MAPSFSTMWPSSLERPIGSRRSMRCSSRWAFPAGSFRPVCESAAPCSGRMRSKSAWSSVRGRLPCTGDLRNGLDATAASFSSTFQEILSTGPFTLPSVTTNVATATGSAHEFVLTAALNAETRPFGKFVPYGTAGGGLLRQSGDLASATFTGNYSFRIGGNVPINETDIASIEYRGKDNLGGVVWRRRAPGLFAEVGHSHRRTRPAWPEPDQRRDYRARPRACRPHRPGSSSRSRIPAWSSATANPPDACQRSAAVKTASTCLPAAGRCARG